MRCDLQHRRSCIDAHNTGMNIVVGKTEAGADTDLKDIAMSPPADPASSTLEVQQVPQRLALRSYEAAMRLYVSRTRASSRCNCSTSYPAIVGVAP